MGGRAGEGDDVGGLFSFATRAAAILHNPGRGGAVTGAGAGAAVGAVGQDGAGRVAFGSGGVVVDSSGMAFGSGAVISSGAIIGSGGSCESSRGTNRCHWVGPILDSTVKPLLWWPGEGTKRRRRTGGRSMELATLWPTRLTIRGVAGAAGGRAVIIAVADAAAAFAIGAVGGASCDAGSGGKVMVAVTAVVAAAVVVAVMAVVVMAVVAVAVVVVVAAVVVAVVIIAAVSMSWCKSYILGITATRFSTDSPVNEGRYRSHHFRNSRTIFCVDWARFFSGTRDSPSSLLRLSHSASQSMYMI